MSSSLRLTSCVPSDAAELARTHLAAFRPSPLHAALWGDCPVELLQQRYETGFCDGIIAATAAKKETTMQQQESSHHRDDEKEEKEIKYCLKVIDTATNDIAAYAVWVFLPNGYRIENDPGAHYSPLPEGSNDALCRQACEAIGRLGMSDARRREEGHWALNLLGTHPRYRRRGAATMLVAWGLKKADEREKMCFVDAANGEARALYRRYGFVDVREISMDLGSGKDGAKLVAMAREAKTVGSGEN